MAIIAFLFSGRLPDDCVDDTDVRSRLVRTLVAESVAGRAISATLGDGLVLFDELAFRPKLVQKYRSGHPCDDPPPSLADPLQPSLGAWTNVLQQETFALVGEPDWTYEVQSQADPRAVAYLLSDFAQAHREAWHTGDPNVIDTALAAGPLTAFAVAPITKSTAIRLHQALIPADDYIGAMHVDAGHPGLFRVLWRDLIPTHQVVGTDLRFVDVLPGHEPDRYPLEEEEVLSENWWSGVGASSFSWIALADAFDYSNTIDPSPDSPRGATVRAALNRILAQTPMEQIIRQLTNDTSRFPPGPQLFSAAKMPGADDVVVPEAKLRGYVLNPNHPDGRHKARLFQELLCIEADDWQFLAEQLRRGVRRAPALREVRGDDFGVRFSVISAVKGRNGSVKPVLSGWIVRPGEVATLVTALVARRGTEADIEASDVPVLLPGSRQQWELLWDVAAAAASGAADLTVPNPVFTTRVPSMGAWLAEGAEGAALVRVLEESSGFATWLRAAAHGGPGPGSGTWTAAPMRGYDRASAWADTFAEVLGWHGIECEVYATFDGESS